MSSHQNLSPQHPVTKIHFYKYQATRNDFVLADNREGKLSFSDRQVSGICDRRFGIGGDGLILLEKDASHDFRMVYRNSDGSASFCGNGCRAIVHFANHLGMIGNHATFAAYDGSHRAEIQEDTSIKVSLLDVTSIEKKTAEDFYINTGTDHHVRFVKDLERYPVIEEGRKIRYSDMYQPRGTNADFVELGKNGTVSFRIYERGVEDETYSSGSGATACALVASSVHGLSSPIHLISKGGPLRVDFERLAPDRFANIHFIGPVQQVFEVDWKLP